MKKIYDPPTSSLLYQKGEKDMKSVTDQTLVFTPNKAQVKGDDFSYPFSKDTCKQLRVEMKYRDVKKIRSIFRNSNKRGSVFQWKLRKKPKRKQTAVAG